MIFAIIELLTDVREIRIAGLFTAVVYQPSYFCAQVLAVNYHIDKSMLKKKLRPLEAFGKFDLDGLIDGPRTGKAYQSFGFGNNYIA